MTTFQQVLTLIAISSGLCSCSSTKTIKGIYVSNFAIAYYSSAKIYFKNDSLFSYCMYGHMMSDTATGKYTIDKHKLTLTYDPFVSDTSLYSKYGRQAVLVSEALTNSYSSTRPEQFYIGHKKLYLMDSIGNVCKKAFGISRQKKYLFWGQHYLTKRTYYLKSLD